MKILIFESHNYHEEVILPQINYLLSDSFEKHEVHLLINENIKYKNITFPSNVKIKLIKHSKIKKIFQIFNIINYVNKNNFDIVIFNSLEDKFLKILNIFLDSKIKKIAILHNVDKLEENRLNFNNFFVLSDNLLNFCKENYPSYNFSSFYPLIYDNFEKNNKYILPENIYITIPGLIEKTRRDYIGLISLIKENKINKNIKFIILGNISKGDGPEVLRYIKNAGIEDKFILFDKYVPYTKFFSILNSTDLIMPLIHPNVDNYEKYKHFKISASFNMAFSFKKPLLMFEEFSKIEEFKNFAFFYNFNNFSNILNRLNKESIKTISNNIKHCKKFSFEYQYNNYINFLKSL